MKRYAMTQEDKQLLLEDLCARLPYGVKITDGSNVIKANPLICIGVFVCDGKWKPFLRPMSNMTEEESNELESITFPLMEKDWDGNENPSCIRWIDIPKYMDFILSHHFDYRGLIEKGLALEAPDGMYRKEG
jgi:hypothetical protein